MCTQQDDGEVGFFVGTQTLKQETNQVHLIRYDEDETQKVTIFSHPFGEIWKLNSSPHDKRMLTSCYHHMDGMLKNQISSKAALLTIPEDLDGGLVPFEHVQELNITSNDIKTAEFHPSDNDSIGVVTDSKIHIVKMGDGTVRPISESVGTSKFKQGKWALHHQGSQFLALAENQVISYDARDMNKTAWTITNEQVFRDVDCNPHKQCHIVTGSDDGCIRIWDYRNIKEPIFSRNDHSHWIWAVRFNTFHDQLILSSSSDSRVNITCAYSVSSEATNPDRKADSTLQDGLLESFSYHEDSVYCAEWSSADPWIFASLSFDGRFILTKISKEVKYKILL